VVPTLGHRIDYLKECLNSIRSAGCKNIYVVGPKAKILELEEISGLFSKLIDDPGNGLPGAINAGIFSFPEEVKYVGWLGDDDLLTVDSLIKSCEILDNDSNVVATYGKCSYIDEQGNTIFTNGSGKWASRYMHFLPNLLPQPGSVYRRTAYEIVGGVKSTYPLSFDFELFFNLRKIGRLHYIPSLLSQFRWHSNSLSVNQREQAVRQTSQIRKNFLPKSVKVLSFIWEPLIIFATCLAGKYLTKKLKG